MSVKPWHSIVEAEGLSFFKQRQKEILDIFIFGSSVKGKENPKDIDILILFKEKKDFTLAQEFRRILELKITIPIEIILKTYTELFSTDFFARESILAQAKSILRKKTLAKSFGYDSAAIFVYQLTEKSKSDRMRFYYSLYGRNSPGMLKQLDSRKLTDTVILCPLYHKERMKEYLNSWKISYQEIEVLFPEKEVR